MRVILIGVGILLLLAAVGATIGIASSTAEGEGPESPGEWMITAIILLAFYAVPLGMFHFAHRLGVREHRRQLASAFRRARAEILPAECPRCHGRRIVRGPPPRLRATRRPHIARCLGCGARNTCSQAVWRELPDALLGDPFETDEDRHYLVRSEPMSRGQIVVCFAGLMLGNVAMLCLLHWSRGAVLSWSLPLVGAIVFWWLGRRWFPATPKPGLQCEKCGHDLRWVQESQCPGCGMGLDFDMPIGRAPHSSGGVKRDGPLQPTEGR